MHVPGIVTSILTPLDRRKFFLSSNLGIVPQTEVAIVNKPLKH
jgi:hypothetical protein